MEENKREGVLEVIIVVKSTLRDIDFVLEESYSINYDLLGNITFSKEVCIKIVVRKDNLEQAWVKIQTLIYICKYSSRYFFKCN